ncbi:MAG: hypothetical protein GEV03_00455 [Streptosporangiales bacterium]|nr:hypothetical protein [Streptosporangiales bacterium]
MGHGHDRQPGGHGRLRGRRPQALIRAAPQRRPFRGCPAGPPARRPPPRRLPFLRSRPPAAPPRRRR